jgi:CobQ-like glutamine amidotransferase family enzyme
MAKVNLSQKNKVKKTAKFGLVINHLYSESLNIYGDLGNILALKYRGEKREIGIEIVHTEIGGKMIEADIYFIGGGQDLDQIKVYEDLLKHKDFIKKEVEKGKVFLLICGGYQLFGKFFVDGNGNMIEGLGILDLETKALDANVASRCIGNIVVELNEEFVKAWEIDTNFSKHIVGFENHGGQTSPFAEASGDSSIHEIGNVLVGFGNNSSDKIEGCFYKNIICSYLHGSFLPKNPHIADAILKKALKNKYKSFEFKDIDNEMEKSALKEVEIKVGLD